MNKLNVKNTICKALVILFVLFSFLMSKTYYFGIQYRKKYQFIFYFIALVSVLFLKKYNHRFRKVSMVPLCLIVLFAINLSIYGLKMDSLQVNTVLGHILNVFVAMIMVWTINARTFSRIYLNILLIFCIISIPCVILANINPELARSFCQPGYIYPDAYGYSPYYTWGMNGMIIPRNSGPFWEPGAFQGFINIGILFLLFNVDEGTIKNKLFYFIVFVFTLVTTKSATGYLTLLLIFIFEGKKIQNKLFGGKYKQLFRFGIIILLIVTIGFIFSSNIISDKIARSNGKFNTTSATMRTEDIKGGILMIKEGGLFGLGETNLRDSMKVNYHVNTDDSVGLTMMTYTYGILFSSVYLLSMCRGVKSIFNVGKTKDVVFIIFILTILHLTEGLWFLPFYLYIAFYRIPQIERNLL